MYLKFASEYMNVRHINISTHKHLDNLLALLAEEHNGSLALSNLETVCITLPNGYKHFKDIVTFVESLARLAVDGIALECLEITSKNIRDLSRTDRLWLESTVRELFLHDGDEEVNYLEEGLVQ